MREVFYLVLLHLHQCGRIAQAKRVEPAWTPPDVARVQAEKSKTILSKLPRKQYMSLKLLASFDVENGRNRLAHGDVEVLGAGVALDIGSGGLVFRLVGRHDYMGDISYR
jgi:hypothetical protein